jgi:hypothetical protein
VHNEVSECRCQVTLHTTDDRNYLHMHQQQCLQSSYLLRVYCISVDEHLCMKQGVVLRKNSGPFHLLGQGFGGLIALSYATTYPDFTQEKVPTCTISVRTAIYTVTVHQLYACRTRAVVRLCCASLVGYIIALDVRMHKSNSIGSLLFKVACTIHTLT